MRQRYGFGLGLLMLTAGCATHQPRHIGAPLDQPTTIARATIIATDGHAIGMASVRPVVGGLRITLEASGLTPGWHGAHIHAIGRCDPPDFASAGPHWNPTGTQHGVNNPAGPHMGDLPNLIVGHDGRGTLGVIIPGATLAGLLDADGAAVVIHADSDDLVSDPSGNSGARVACGVFARA